jgi:hypothetical protein
MLFLTTRLFPHSLSHVHSSSSMHQLASHHLPYFPEFPAGWMTSLVCRDSRGFVAWFAIVPEMSGRPRLIADAVAVWLPPTELLIAEI